MDRHKAGAGPVAADPAPKDKTRANDDADGSLDASRAADLFGRAPRAMNAASKPKLDADVTARKLAQDLAHRLSPRTAFSVAEVAHRAGLSVRSVWNAIEQGALRVHRPGGVNRVVVLAADETAWLRAREGVDAAASSKGAALRAKRGGRHE